VPEEKDFGLYVKRPGYAGPFRVSGAWRPIYLGSNALMRQFGVSEARLGGTMPLVAFALIAYLAGLLAGFADILAIGVVVVTAAAVLGVGHGRQVAIGFAALATAGIVAARTTARGTEHCLRDTVQRHSVALVVDDSVAPGEFVRGRVADCDGSVTMSVERGAAPPGSTVLA
jgi:hypothetical protein